MNEVRRDRKLRRLILAALYAARGTPLGGLSGLSLIDTVNDLVPADLRFEDAQHATALIRDLAHAGYLSIEDTRKHPRFERYGPDRMMVRITAQGVALHDERVAADPNVEDARDAE